MAKLTKLQKLERIRSYIAELSSGNINKPITGDDMLGFAHICNELEKLRLMLVERESAEVEKQKLISQTVSNVTHDLKTPLALIAGYAEALGDGMDDKDYAGLIRERALEMNDDVLKIIDSAKSDVQEMRKQHSIVPAKKYFEKAFAKQEALAAEKGIKLKIGKIPSIYVFITEKEFDCVILNLISNAVKFTPKGGTITVKFRKNGKYLAISVKDTGCGIAKDDLPYIFERYYTEDKAHTHGGSGIGLSVVKDTVEAHGGQISVHSKQGKGAKFIVVIPYYSRGVISRVKAKPTKERNKWVAFLLCLFGGFFGIHKFYEGNYGLGVLFMLTGGLFVFGWLISIFVYLAKPNPYYI